MFHFPWFNKNHKYESDPLYADEDELPPSEEDLEELERRHEEAMQDLRDAYENVDNDFILDDYDRDEDE